MCATTLADLHVRPKQHARPHRADTGTGMRPALPILLGGLLSHSTARGLNQASILQLQRVTGNRAVQRHLWRQRRANPGHVTSLAIQRDWWGDEEEAGAEESESSVTDWISEQAGGTVDWVGEQAAGAADWVGEQTNAAADWAGETAGAAADWAGEQAGAAAEWVEEQAGAAASWVEDQVEGAGQGWTDDFRGPAGKPEDEEQESADEFRLRVLAARPRDALGAWGRLDQRERMAVTLYVGQIYGAGFAQGFLQATSNPDFGIDVDTPANVSAQQLLARGYRFWHDAGDYTKWVLPTGREMWIQNQLSAEEDPAVKEAQRYCQEANAGKRNLERLMAIAQDRIDTDDYPEVHQTLSDELTNFSAGLHAKQVRCVELRQQVSPRAHEAFETHVRCLQEIMDWIENDFYWHFFDLPAPGPRDTPADEETEPDDE